MEEKDSRFGLKQKEYLALYEKFYSQGKATHNCTSHFNYLDNLSEMFAQIH